MWLFGDRAIVMPDGMWVSWGLGVLHLLALGLLVAVVLAWAHHAGRRLLVASGVMTVLAVLLTYLGTVRSSDIPVDWITILHHGLERKSIMHLYALGAHTGVNFPFVLSAVAGDAPNLHDVVWFNLLLALVNATVFLHIATHIVGLAWAVPWTVAFALNAAMFQASFSELPTHLLALYFLAAVIAWTVLNDPLRQPRIIRGAAYALCALLTLFAALTRSEAAFLGELALALYAGHFLLGEERWSAAGRRLLNAGKRPLGFFSEHPAAVVALCVVGAELTKSGIPALVSRTWVAGLYPFNPSFFSLFPYLPMLLLPIGASIAVLFGFIHAAVHFRRFGGLALSLFVLVRVYFAAWSEYFEMGRYLSYVLPAIFFLGLFGKQELDDIVRRRWRPNWCRAAGIAYLMAWFTLPLPGMPGLYARPEYHRGGGFAQLLLDRDTQQEVRHLVTLTEDNPQCVFVARVLEDQYGDPMVAPQFAYLVFGAPVRQPVYVPEKEAALDEVIARYASGASCVRLYYGGDCNLTFADRCKQFIAGRRRVGEHRFWARPYNNPLQSGYGAPEIVLATYE